MKPSESNYINKIYSFLTTDDSFTAEINSFSIPWGEQKLKFLFAYTIYMISDDLIWVAHAVLLILFFLSYLQIDSSVLIYSLITIVVLYHCSFTAYIWSMEKLYHYRKIFKDS